MPVTHCYVHTVFLPHCYLKTLNKFSSQAQKFITLDFSPATINASFIPVIKYTATVAQSSE